MPSGEFETADPNNQAAADLKQGRRDWQEV
jgi:hypothetical protein